MESRVDTCERAVANTDGNLEWITALEQGETPLTEDVLEDLRRNAAVW